MTANVVTIDTVVLPEEDGKRTARESFPQLVARLSHQSVVKHFDAYADIAWDTEEFRIDPDDPRWEQGVDEELRASAWYQAQPAGVRSRLGLHLVASFMKIGLQFEGVLKQGLLLFAADLPNRSPEFRYAYHEIIEESQHTLMFQEFVNRSGLDSPGLTWDLKLGSRAVVQMARRFPEMFFVFVLGGEDPIDHVQRKVLRSGREIHPLLERIMRIHVTEEARHLSFARHYLRETVPALGRRQRAAISVQAPFTLALMAGVMMRPPRQLVRTYSIPEAVLAEAYRPDGPAAQEVRDSLRKVRELLDDLGLITPVSLRLWRRFGIWDQTG